MKRWLLILPLCLMGCTAGGTGTPVPPGAEQGKGPGSATLSFSASAGANADLAPLAGSAQGTHANGMTILNIVSGAGTTRRNVTVMIPGGLPVAGKTYVGADPAKVLGQTDLASVQYVEGGTRTWQSTGGVMRVDSVASGSLTLTFDGVTMGTPNTTTANPATGTFNLSGTVTAAVQGL